MEAVIEIGKWLLEKDPLLAVCILILGYWQYRSDQNRRRENMEFKTRLDGHLDPQNKYPHPACEWGEKNYAALTDSLKQQHKENREDHQTIFKLLRREQ